MAYRFNIFCIAVNLALPLSLAAEELVDYDKAQVWRTFLPRKKDIQRFMKIADEFDLSIWSLSNNRTDYLVHHTDQRKVRHRLRDSKLDYKVVIANVRNAIEGSKATTSPWTGISLRVGHRLDFESYPSIQIINEYLSYLNDYFPSVLKIRRIGETVQKRPIKMIHISNGNPKNKLVVLIAGQHAREWVSITSALYIANNIATNFDRQPEYVKNRDWYIVPLVNPDGYAYTQTKDRLWRKNLSKNARPQCVGVDLNRNYAKHWHVKDVTESDPCQEDYAGPFPLSEPETMALQDMVDSFGNKTPEIFIDFHSYGQMIIYPWSVQDKKSKNIKNLMSNAEIMKSAIRNATGSKYTHGTPSQMLYVVSGTAIDWFHARGVPLSYSVEARDMGKYGFLLPASQIKETGKEMLALTRALAKNLDSTVRRGRDDEWF